jgi:hypothetical protein
MSNGFSKRLRPLITASIAGAIARTISCALLIIASPPQQPQLNGSTSIREAELREKVAYLASKELKGRGDGAPELRIAAQYIAEAFRKSGVKPAGDNGTYFQTFQMFSPRLGDDNSFRVSGDTVRLGQEYIPHYLSASGAADGPLVFVGYGVSAPHLKFDELAGIDVRGKVVLVIDGNPHAEDFDDVFNRIHPDDPGSVLTKARRLRDAGAVGLVVIQNPRIPNFSITDIASTYRPDFPRKDVPMGSTTDPRNPRIPVVILSTSAARDIVPSLREVQRRIDETLQPQFIDLAKRATLRTHVVRNVFTAQNVLGLIEGSDARRRSETVVVGAHYDHDGEQNGQIWPGADDNASGVAGILELAEAFANGARAPARSVLLSAYAGEEKGQVGSLYYVGFPSVPLDRTVAMVQMDMIGRNEEHEANNRLRLARETAAQNANAVNMIGTTFSPALRTLLEDVNRRVGLDLKFRYDDTPENLLRRSDQWAFLQRSIPSVFVHTGDHPDYHQPTDTADKLNYPKMEKIVRLVYLAVEQLATASDRPSFQVPVSAEAATSGRK